VQTLSFQDAVAKVPEGARLLIGGFMGLPVGLIAPDHVVTPAVVDYLEGNS